MPETVRLTKNELRAQQHKLDRLQKYLPTLQLKKAMLQTEVGEAMNELGALIMAYDKIRASADSWASLLAENSHVDAKTLAQVKEVYKRYENVAGVEVPHYEGVDFEEVVYSLFETPPWLDSVVRLVRKVVESRIRIVVGQEKKAALEKELREVSIRVNLFEKILIPRAQQNIKKISVFLGDMQLAAVCQAKVAKKKVEKRNEVKKLVAVPAP